MKRKRALTIMELIASLGLLVGLFVTMAAALRVATRWGAASSEEVEIARRAEVLRLRVTNAAIGAQPVNELSLLADGRIVEALIPGAARSWGHEDLLLRGPNGYTIFSRDGSRLRTQRIDARGHVTAGPFLRAVEETAFTIERDAQGEPRGISYRIGFKRGEASSGFVALRAIPNQKPLVAPTPAPRFGERKR